MRAMLAIARRDLAAAFTTPLGWVLLAASGLLCAVVFASAGFRNGEPANLRPVLVILGWATVLLAPAVAMRSLAEERRGGTLDLLGSAPVRESAIVLGKFVAAVALLGAVLLPSLVLALPLELHGSPDFGELACGLLGLLLVGGAIAALGILASSLASSQVLAYLGAMVPWLGLMLAVKLLPPLSPPAVAEALRAIDPLRRLDAFVIGLFDSANLAYFVAAVAVFLALATLVLARPRWRPAIGWARTGRIAHLAVRVALLAAVGSGAVLLASQEALRLRLDLTRTRAYSLAPSTVELLRSLPGEGWAIDLLVVPGEGDGTFLRQIDEVLRRFERARPGLRTGRIDPTDPADLPAYERLLERLATSFAGQTAAFEAALDEGIAEIGGLNEYAAAALPEMTGRLAALAPGDPQRPMVESAAAFLEQVRATGPRLLEEISKLLQSSPAQPFPDWEGARAAVVAHHRLRSDQLATALPRDGSAQRFAQALRDSMDRLERLPGLRLDEVGRAIAGGEAAVITGPLGAASIPGWQLFPRSTIGDDATVRFDRRFRGEQLLAAALRGLEFETPPVVVVMHAEAGSLLRRIDGGSDLFAIADELRASRIEVREWAVGTAPPPALRPGQAVAWMVVPPLRRTALEPSAREVALLEETRRRLDDGEAVLLSVAPSVLPLVGQRDPWAALLDRLGIEADTARAVLELGADAEGRGEVRATHAVSQRSADHPLADAIAERNLALFYPVPLSIRSDTPGRVEALLSLPPSDRRWLEEEWRRTREAREVPLRKRQTEALPMVVAIERPRPGGAAPQRVLVVASPGWMLSSLADLAVSLGGERLAWAHPGNRELARSGAAWLLGLDGWIAAGDGGREVARLSGITPTARLAWTAALLVGMPLVPLSIGGVVLWRRGRSA